MQRAGATESTSAAGLSPVLMRAWRQRGWLAWLLLPVSLLFGILTWLRRLLYAGGMLSSRKMPVPVVVVGNLFVGGTGKTPLVIWLVAQLAAAGFRPGVVSRGYGGARGVPLPVGPDSAPGLAGDEPVLIAQRSGVPVMVGRDRVAAAEALLAAHPEINIIVSDDGLQHYRLDRDVEIVLFDARGAGNGWLMPAGPLREPLSRRRDFTVVNAHAPLPGMPAASFRMTLAGDSAVQLTDRARSMPLAALAAHSGPNSPNIAAVAGIGNPARYFAMLRDAGLSCAEIPLPDHYPFEENPFASITADIILITEKDAVKCLVNKTIAADERLWVVPVAAQIHGPLAEKLLEKLRGRPTA